MNATQPLPNRSPSFGDTISEAFDRMVLILFRPFDLSRWLAIGFGAFLAGLGEGGGGGGMNWGQGRRGAGGGGDSLREFWDEVSTYVTDNWSWLVPAVIAGVGLLLVIGLLIVWLSSRGRFMLLHNVATNSAEVVRPWNAYAAHAWSLFRFRVVLGLLSLLVLVPLGAVAGWSVFVMVREEAILPMPMAATVVGFGLVMVLGLVVLLVEKFTKDFAVPIMWLRTTSVVAAWQEVRRLVGANLGTFVLYLLVYLALLIASAFVVLAFVVVTCCIAGCLMAIPYLGTVLMLPVIVFFRAFSAGFLARFGPEFDVFRSAAGTAPMASPTPPGSVPPESAGSPAV